jgi:hypothetical protein
MKSIVALTTQRIVLILAIATVVAVPAVAKEGNWKLDVDHSTARILVGTNAFNIGVAHVSGTVERDATQPTNPVLDLSIDQEAGGKLLTFKSQRAIMNRDGKLQVSGYLTLRRVVREVYLNAGEDYHGPVYGEPAIETVTREVTFVLPMEHRGEKAEITAEANIYRENFPELFAAVYDVYWQPVIQDKACEMPSAGEDYAGALCTGTVVGPDRSPGFASIGEDYHGFEASVPKGNLMTIVLNLHLTRENPEPATTARNLR